MQVFTFNHQLSEQSIFEKEDSCWIKAGTFLLLENCFLCLSILSSLFIPYSISETQNQIWLKWTSSIYHIFSHADKLIKQTSSCCLKIDKFIKPFKPRNNVSLVSLSHLKGYLHFMGHKDARTAENKIEPKYRS